MKARIEVRAKARGGWTVLVLKGPLVVWQAEAITLTVLRRQLDRAAKKRRRA